LGLMLLLLVVVVADRSPSYIGVYIRLGIFSYG
jgi:hypothetical protein